MALNGQCLYGGAAYRRQKSDKDSSYQLSRMELKRHVNEAALSQILQLPKERLTRLESWGLPEKIILKYSEAMSYPNDNNKTKNSNIKMPSLFDWQIECLLTNNGSTLTGGDLIYSGMFVFMF